MKKMCVTALVLVCGLLFASCSPSSDTPAPAQGNFAGDEISKAMGDAATEAQALAVKLENAGNAATAAEILQEASVYFEKYNTRIAGLENNSQGAGKKYREEKKLLAESFSRLGLVTSKLAGRYSADPAFNDALQKMSASME
jgi:ABC-type glycerol-3-phosphate transport system substrate-binding protein